MNQSMLSILGLDLLKKAMCGSQTVNLEKKEWGFVIVPVSGIKYKNCTEQLPYICHTGRYQLLIFLTINSLQFIHHCDFQYQQISGKVQTTVQPVLRSILVKI